MSSDNDRHRAILPDDSVLGAVLLQGGIPEEYLGRFRPELFAPERQRLAQAIVTVTQNLGACPRVPVEDEMARLGAGIREIQTVGSLLGQGADPDELPDLVDALEERARRKTIAERPQAELTREGLDLVLTWPDSISFRLAAIRDGREGARGELTVIGQGRRLSWGAWSLPSTAARETLRKKLDGIASRANWGARLEEAAWLFTEAARQGEPLVALTGRPTTPTREVVPRLLYEGEPTLVYGDGDTGKSLFATALAVAVHSGTPLPFGLRPVSAIPVAYLDWETSRDTLEDRLGKLAAGLGIPPPTILYKRMTRPLTDEAGMLAAEFVRRGVRFIIIDSMMFAVASGEGIGFHEPIIGFYNALRLFAPAAILVLSHVTGDDARRGGAGRPFGGAFAFNAPRLIWEAKRDRDVPGTAIGFVCRKANNLPRLPEPFGLLFTEGQDAITIQPLDLAEASPGIVAGATLTQQLNLALARAPATAEELAKALNAKKDTVSRLLRRGREKGHLHERTDGGWEAVK